MNIRRNELDNYTVIALEGNIEMSTMKLLKQQLLEVADSSEKDIKIDFSLVDYLDSSGLGVLLTISKILKSRNKKVKLINIPDKISMVLELSSVKNLIED